MSEPALAASFRKVPLVAGVYFVATPIGSARDITLRALDVLASADVIAAEDTRTARRLMELHGIAVGDRPMIAYHDHNGAERRPILLKALSEGKSIAYVSEAGTPLVADPGFQLGRDVAEAGHAVFSVPGPSAVLAALNVCGLPTDRFQFLGFAPSSGKARKAFLNEVATSSGTSVIFESPKRVHRILDELMQTCGAERKAAVCRELTKKFEEVLRGSLADLSERTRDKPLKGECVITVDRAGKVAPSETDLRQALEDAMQTHSKRDAIAYVSETFGVARRTVYQLALEQERPK